jgi:hypothetical protein
MYFAYPDIGCIKPSEDFGLELDEVLSCNDCALF